MGSTGDTSFGSRGRGRTGRSTGMRRSGSEHAEQGSWPWSPLPSRTDRCPVGMGSWWMRPQCQETPSQLSASSRLKLAVYY